MFLSSSTHAHVHANRAPVRAEFVANAVARRRLPRPLGLPAAASGRSAVLCAQVRPLPRDDAAPAVPAAAPPRGRGGGGAGACGVRARSDAAPLPRCPGSGHRLRCDHAPDARRRGRRRTSGRGRRMLPPQAQAPRARARRAGALSPMAGP